MNNYNTVNTIIVLVTILIGIYYFIPVIEHAGSPATLTQLATSSVNTLPYVCGYGECGYNNYGGGYYGGSRGRPFNYNSNVRPVMQRGVNFYYPSWSRF